MSLLPRLPLILLLLLIAPALRAEPLVHDKDRIIFCGDSITGQGAKGGPTGWIGLIGEGLTLAHPSDQHTLLGLGGSGSTVGAWLNFEKKSQTQPVYFDVKDLDVKATLDGGGEILVIMLGMNDVLSPSLKNAPADFDAWATRYRQLADALKARVHPRVLAFATVPICTEDLHSPKNQVEDQLNTRLAALAKEEGAIILPVHETLAEILAQGRGFKPDYHVTVDFVHPNPQGHLAIAAGMLRGLGEGDAAQKLLEQHAKLTHAADADLPTLSYTVTPAEASPDQAVRNFTVHYQWTAPGTLTAEPSVQLTVPTGWTVTPASLTGSQGDFQVSGTLDHLVNELILQAAAGDVKKTTPIVIPAGWRLAVGPGTGAGWKNNSDYDPSQDTPPLDATLQDDAAFTTPQAFPGGETPPWQHYLSSFNNLSLNAPGSLDMAGAAFFKIHDVAYGARWIYSDKDRPIDIDLGVRGWSSNFSTSIWLNGTSLYQGKLATEPGHKKTVEGKLQHGWNRLVFKSGFIQWLWAFSIDLNGKTGDDLADLRFATAPPPAPAPAPKK